MERRNKRNKKTKNLTRDELNERLKNLAKKTNKNEKAIRKRKEEMEEEIKTMEKRTLHLKRKIDSNQQRILKINVTDPGERFIRTYFPTAENLNNNNITLPKDIVNVIFNFYLKRNNPTIFLINKSFYNVLHDVTTSIRNNELHLINDNKYEQSIALFRAKDILVKLEANYIIDHFKSNDSLSHLNRIFSVLNYKKKKNEINEEEFNNEILIFRRFIVLLELLIRECLYILKHTIAFHNAALNSNLNTVILNDEKTLKWSITQKISENIKKHYLQKMSIVLYENGAPFNLCKKSFKWMLKIYKKCFGAKFQNKQKLFDYGTFQKVVATEITFV